jgi:hypothetical protein
VKVCPQRTWLGWHQRHCRRLVARGRRKWYDREWWRIWRCRILSRTDAQSHDEPINNGCDTIPALRRGIHGTVFGRERVFRLVLVRSVHVAPTATGMVPYPEWVCHGRVDVVDGTGRGRRRRLDRGLVRKHVRAVLSISLLIVVIQAVSTVVSSLIATKLLQANTMETSMEQTATNAAFDVPVPAAFKQQTNDVRK